MLNLSSYGRSRESRLLQFPIMTMARHIVALLQSHVAGDEERFLSVATQLAAHEARQGHGKLAQQLQELITAAKDRSSIVDRPAMPQADRSKRPAPRAYAGD